MLEQSPARAGFRRDDQPPAASSRKSPGPAAPRRRERPGLMTTSGTSASYRPRPSRCAWLTDPEVGGTIDATTTPSGHCAPSRSSSPSRGLRDTTVEAVLSGADVRPPLRPSTQYYACWRRRQRLLESWRVLTASAAPPTVDGGPAGYGRSAPSSPRGRRSPSSRSRYASGPPPSNAAARPCSRWKS